MKLTLPDSAPACLRSCVDGEVSWKAPLRKWNLLQTAASMVRQRNQEKEEGPNFKSSEKLEGRLTIHRQARYRVSGLVKPTHSLLRIPHKHANRSRVVRVAGIV